MSTFNRIVLGVCLSVVCAVYALARGQSMSQDSPSNQMQPPKQARVNHDRYVLLTDGRLISGVVSETARAYIVEQQSGTMTFARKVVEGAFDSVHKAYEYRLSQLPDRDSEERLKLALWCLKLDLKAEAGQLLDSVLELNPNNAQAKAMRQSLTQTEKRLARRERDPAIFAPRQRDPELRQTNAEDPADPRPVALDSDVLRNAQRGMGVRDIPVIFDLPLPLAIKRTQEFTGYVHPILQAYCARCHDGHFQGQFQLVPIKSRADRSADALRANLDATLRLIDPVNPSRSVLLSSTLRPHGHGTNPRPIFAGSNDRAYKVLAQWAKHLSAPKDGTEAASRGAAGGEEVFAVDRNRTGAAQPMKSAGVVAGAPSKPGYSPATGGPVISQDPSDPQEFPIPFAVSGVKPKLPPPRTAADRSAKGALTTPASKAPAADAKVKQAPVGDNDDDDDDDDLEDHLPNPPKVKTTTGAAKAPAKPLKIDPNLLERALQYRNATRANPGS